MALEAETTGEDGFEALGLGPELLECLTELGYEEPTPVQQQAIPPLLEGRDLLAEAPTGTGKTAAFALPMLQRLDSATEGGGPQGLILVPTRELAMQVGQAVHRYGRGLGVGVLPVYGGQPIGHQLRGLRRGVDVVVATPGRAVDHLKRGSLRLDGLRFIVLDEADEMLDMGFAEDLDAILAEAPPERQSALFSATISPGIARIAERHLTDPVRISLAREGPPGASPLVRQIAYVAPRTHKLAALSRILDVEAPTSVLVFTRTRLEVDELTEALAGRGYDTAALHGGLAQEQRDRVMARFRDGSVEVLVATDVAARGLDIEQVSHVVNYDVPSDPGAYVHRIGRTGRAGRKGVAITLVEPREQRLLRNIERLIGRRIEIARLPTVADLRARRMELLEASLREALLGDGLDRYRGVVEPLAEEFDLFEIALAAASLADVPSGADRDEPELPVPTLGSARRERPARPARTSHGPRRQSRNGDGAVRLFLGGGRQAGIRPADIVGAITNEAGIGGQAIGAIEIFDRYALVEVPDEAADDIIRALREGSIRGRRFPVHRDRDAERQGR